ncbi:hypothetical protein [Paenibacillus sp. OSY-SE]|uniref:hypothetical protein n=1 Tax=Paenibacillus sp. OSY-SE TaxID=1196323 RepID=UPI00036EBD01|nr:hypothetical protein [Paenibacillus sp. OSY-SE]
MKGIVAMINSKKGFLAVRTPSNEYSIVEVLEMELPELGDIISGNLESLGSETLVNLTQGIEIDVFIQEIYTNKASAIRILNAN